MSKAKKAESGTKTLFVKFHHDKDPQKITIPAGCKVTFGPLCPGTKGSGNGSEATALRIYSPGSASLQIACFVKVEHFYETDSITCIKKVTKSATKVQEYQEGGVTKQRSVEVKVSEWKDVLAEDSDDGGAVGAFKALAAEQDMKPF